MLNIQLLAAFLSSSPKSATTAPPPLHFPTTSRRRPPLDPQSPASRRAPQPSSTSSPPRPRGGAPSLTRCRRRSRPKEENDSTRACSFIPKRPGYSVRSARSPSLCSLFGRACWIRDCGVEAAKMEKLSSAVAFMEGGVQDACDDACNICLEFFCDSDPSTVTSCKHDFHLQCILEWCQRSSQCPMCWQAISMKDPLSQELLEAVEQERNVQADRSRTTTLFHHPMLGHFEVPVGTDDGELEERIMQHLAAAAVTRRSYRHARREAHRGRSGAHGRTQIVVFSTTETTSSDPISSDSRHIGDSEHSHATVSAPVDSTVEASAGTSVRNNTSANCPFGSNDSMSCDESSSINQDGAGPSDPQSFSETLKTRLQSVSTKYKDSITKNTRGWKERWLARSDTISTLSSDVRREVNAGMAAVSRLMERLETREGSGSGPSSASSDNDPPATDDQRDALSNFCSPVNGATSSATCASRSASQ